MYKCTSVCMYTTHLYCQHLCIQIFYTVCTFVWRRDKTEIQNLTYKVYLSIEAKPGEGTAATDTLTGLFTNALLSCRQCLSLPCRHACPAGMLLY